MQIYTLRGVEVQFPYEAYACQVCTTPSFIKLCNNVVDDWSCAARLHGQSYPGSARGVLESFHACNTVGR